MILGINSHGLDSDSQTQIKSLKLEHVRATIHWNRYISDAAYRSNRDWGIDNAISNGFKLLVVVHEEPPVWDTGTFAGFCERIAARFPGVEAWQLGNERVFSGIQHPWEWALVHNAAAEAIKKASPTAQVISLAISWQHLTDPFYASFMAEVKPRFLDAQAVHVYSYPLAVGLDITIDNAVKWVPIWFTEFGMSKHEVPVERQHIWLDVQQTQIEQFSVRAAYDWAVDRSYIYALMTSEGAGEMHGIFERDWTPRPTATWLRNK